MNLGEIRALVRVRRPEPRAAGRRLARCHDIEDLRRAARRLIPRPVFDYVDGGADEELSLAANVAEFRRWRFVPRTLAGAAGPDTATEVLGRPVPLPLVLAPTGFTRMMHPAGESAVAAAAARRGLPYTLSTMATTSIPDLAAGPHGDLWFQLYVLRDRRQSNALVDQAAAAGYQVLVVAVDTLVAGRRIRDVRNGLTIPPELSLRSLASIGSRPAYWARMLRSPAMRFANLAADGEVTTIAGTASWFDPSVSWDDIAALRERWPGKLIIKGPLGVAGARRAVAAGADGVQLSNHGGRQLDRTVAPIGLVPAVRDAVGPDIAVLADSGVRHGADIAVAVALGADAVAIGRAYLYGLMAAGEPGVDKALGLLTAQFRRTLQLLGITSVAELRKQGPELLVRS
ncbi:MAG: alpha-hydroxy-acid oxidizing protein [Actinobacteria bacterium]|nr:alpha-hydroxy-acid oxidizing protein [Actinomycetota bacterium]